MSAAYRASCVQNQALAKFWSGRPSDAEPAQPVQDPRFAGVRAIAPMPTAAQMVYLRELERDESAPRLHFHAPALPPMSDEVEHLKPKTEPMYTAADLVFAHCVNLGHAKYRKAGKAKSGPGPTVNRFCPAQKQAGRIAHAKLTVRANNFK